MKISTLLLLLLFSHVVSAQETKHQLAVSVLHVHNDATLSGLTFIEAFKGIDYRHKIGKRTYTRAGVYFNNKFRQYGFHEQGGDMNTDNDFVQQFGLHLGVQNLFGKGRVKVLALSELDATYSHRFKEQTGGWGPRIKNNKVNLTQALNVGTGIQVALNEKLHMQLETTVKAGIYRSREENLVFDTLEQSITRGYFATWIPLNTLSLGVDF